MSHNKLLETLFPREKLNDKILDKTSIGFFTFQHGFSSSEMEQDYYDHKISEMLGFDSQPVFTKAKF